MVLRAFDGFLGHPVKGGYFSVVLLANNCAEFCADTGCGKLTRDNLPHSKDSFSSLQF